MLNAPNWVAPSSRATYRLIAALLRLDIIWSARPQLNRRATWRISREDPAFACSASTVMDAVCSTALTSGARLFGWEVLGAPTISPNHNLHSLPPRRQVRLCNGKHSPSRTFN